MGFGLSGVLPSGVLPWIRRAQPIMLVDGRFGLGRSGHGCFWPGHFSKVDVSDKSKFVIIFKTFLLDFQ